MNQKAVKYLQDNKNKYSKEVLLEELRKAGYNEADIIEAEKETYKDNISQTENKPTSFFNFKTKKVYFTKKEKALDFLVGLLFFPLALNFLVDFSKPFLPYRMFNYYSPFIKFFFILIYAAGLIYFYKRRKYIFCGLVIIVFIYFLRWITYF